MFGAKVDIHSLPDDILLLIISYITVKDIITLRKSSKKFYELTKLRWVWSDAVKRHVIGKGLPIPAAHSASGIKALSAKHLEARAVHVAKFNDNWSSAQPQPRGAVEFSVDTVNAEGNPVAVKEVIFLKGRCGEFLVVWAGDTIECWEVPLDGSGAYRIATWTDQGGIRQVVVNEDPKHPTEIAYMSLDPTDPDSANVFVMALDTFHGTLIPRTLMRGQREHISQIHAMYGDFIVMGDPLLVWNTLGPQATSIAKLRNDAHVLSKDSDVVLAVKKVTDTLIVVRTKCVEVYSAPVWSTKERRYSCSGYIVSALAMDSGPAREAAIAIRANVEAPEASSSSLSPLPPPVTVLLSQAAHTLIQIDLLPRRPSNKGGPTAPYEMPRTPTRVFQIAPSSRQLKASSGGKGIWLQTHNVTNRRAKHPARCIMGFDVCAPAQDPKPWKSNHCEVALLMNRPVAEGGSDVHICQSQLYSRRCDMSEILYKKYCVVAADLEDSVGRIAVGDRRGKIEVLDYA
ncbi:hypothetical protein BDY19DRAFT_897406 [Irpex rosettiformis]|uniref:Uncharacterized protein n=1 Tax=Irpex rosettiformis TaxID=378272 RepID=A0ACB8TSS7_9APHY|nr:hypothetical protein BDY19DRAFT_897406 [Irpex rosettiformis]